MAMRYSSMGSYHMPAGGRASHSQTGGRRARLAGTGLVGAGVLGGRVASSSSRPAGATAALAAAAPSQPPPSPAGPADALLHHHAHRHLRLHHQNHPKLRQLQHHRLFSHPHSSSYRFLSQLASQQQQDHHQTLSFLDNPSAAQIPRQSRSLSAAQPASLFPHPLLSPLSIPAALPDPHASYYRPLGPAMADFQSSDEMARMQELSNKWEPEAIGPLVSERMSSSAITTEYANADPAYQVKTASLPHKYAQYRTCRGDGHCGWRAVAFCYYEILQRIGDKSKFLQEETRLKSYNTLLNQVGFSEYLYEDFADDTFQLLRSTSEAQDGGAALLEFFNDPNQSMSVITYLKLLTSAWIQTHPDEYAPFLDQPVESYCKNYIEPAVCEIEHIGMCALVDALVKPAGIAMEILYLDRTPGEEANTYQFAPADQNGNNLADPPMIRLLYRPGHYDILYKAEDIPQRIVPPVNPQDVLVAFQTSDQRYHPLLPSAFTEVDIPGYSIFSGPEDYTWTSLAPAYNYEQPSLIPPVPTTPTVPMTSNVTVASPFSPTPPTSLVIRPAYYQPNYPLDSHDALQSALPTPTSPYHHPMLNDPGIFRPSQMQLQMPFDAGLQMCQTTIFKNSHYNTAHFRNPDFEPEQWQPGSEYTTTDRSRKRSTHC